MGKENVLKERKQRGRERERNRKRQKERDEGWWGEVCKEKIDREREREGG